VDSPVRLYNKRSPKKFTIQSVNSAASAVTSC
jgi:hypothetical protein